MHIHSTVMGSQPTSYNTVIFTHTSMTGSISKCSIIKVVNCGPAGFPLQDIKIISKEHKSLGGGAM
jgi:hypothetical protein